DRLGVGNRAHADGARGVRPWIAAARRLRRPPWWCAWRMPTAGGGRVASRVVPPVAGAARGTVRARASPCSLTLGSPRTHRSPVAAALFSRGEPSAGHDSTTHHLVVLTHSRHNMMVCRFLTFMM